MEPTERERRFSQLIAQEISAAAKRAGLRQKDIAEAIGVHPVHFSHAVGGRKGLLTVGALMHAAEKLGMDPQEIVARAYALLQRERLSVVPDMTDESRWDTEGAAAEPHRPGEVIGDDGEFTF